MAISRSTSGVSLPTEVANAVWADVEATSAVMRMAQRMALPGSGVSVPVITGEATAAWVAEGEEKPVSDATPSNKMITPYKLAVIQAFSDEFRRDADVLYAEMVRRLPAALAKEFDETIFHGTAPGSGFDVLSDAQEQVLDATDTYGDLVAADGLVADAGGQISGWVLGPKGRSVLLNARNGDGPLLLSNLQTEGGVQNLLGAPVVYSVHAGAGENLGFVGDWTQAYYGIVGGIRVSTSDQATLTGVGNLWQRNMFAVRVEMEVGFVVRDKARFVRLTDGTVV